MIPDCDLTFEKMKLTSTLMIQAMRGMDFRENMRSSVLDMLKVSC